MVCAGKDAKDSHPMTMFNLGILAMQNESILEKNMMKACIKVSSGNIF